MLTLTGEISYRYKFDGQPFTFKINHKTASFTDYNPDGKKTHIIELETPPEPPEYHTGYDNKGQPYELIEWRGAWCQDAGKFARISIQTWDRRTAYVLALWPHKTYGYRGEESRYASESTIARLDNASAARLSALLIAASQPALELRIFGKELTGKAAEEFLASVPTFGL